MNVKKLQDHICFSAISFCREPLDIQKKRKLCLLGISVIVLSLGINVAKLHAQDAAADKAATEKAATEVPMRNGTNLSISLSGEGEKDDGEESDIKRYKTFAPFSQELYDTRANADEEYFKRLNETLVGIQSELKNSAYIVLQETKGFADDNYRLKSLYTYKANLLPGTNYYKAARQDISFFYYLLKSENFLRQAEDFFMSREKAFAVVIPEEELYKIVYALKSLKGIVLLYRGSRRHLREASDSFEYVLGENPSKTEYLQSEEERLDVYRYLVGIHERLFELGKSDFLTARPYLRKKLFYLWKLTEVANSGNEELRDIKLQDLSDRYYSIMDSKGLNYTSLYQPYIVKTLEKVKDSNTLDPAGETENTSTEASEEQAPSADQ